MLKYKNHGYPSQKTRNFNPTKGHSKYPLAPTIKQNKVTKTITEKKKKNLWFEMKGAHRDLKTLSRGGVSDGLSSNIANTPENSGADDLGLHRMKRHTSLVPFPRVQHYPTQRMYTMKLD